MKLLFTYNNTLGSKLIRWALNEPVSHVAIEFPDGLVVHSKLLTGVTLEWTSSFHNKNTTLYSLDYSVHWRTRRDLLKFILDVHANAPYDYKGLWYFAWRTVLFKFFNIPYPARSKWQQANQFLCTELASRFVDTEISDFISPYKLYQELLNGRL